MHETPLWLQCWQFAAAVLGVAAGAAAALPVIALLTALAGRREHPCLGENGARAMTRLALALSPLWPVLLVAEVARQILVLRGGLSLPEGFSPWMPALLPYSSAVMAWLAGVLSLAFLAHRWRSGPATAMCVALLLMAAGCFFAAQALPLWPFAGLPEGLTAGQAARAIALSTLHVFFTQFTPAGALALLYLHGHPHLAHSWGCPAEEEHAAARWCALWAMIGYGPYCLDRWGVLLGHALRPGQSLRHMGLSLLSLAAITLAVACWTLLFARRAPRRLLPLNVLALILLALGAALPALR